jgi:hypothetical protein
MNKPYLLIAGDYYPSGDTGDWIGCFSTYEEAKEQVEFVVSSASQFDHYNVKRGEKKKGGPGMRLV